LNAAEKDYEEIKIYLAQYGENPPKKFRYSFEKFCQQVSDMPYMFSEYEYSPDY